MRYRPEIASAGPTPQVPAIQLPSGSALQLRPIYRAVQPTRPLQFPSLSAFRAAATRVCEQEARVKGLSDLTLRWWTQSLDVFLMFLRDAKLESSFLSGGFERQLVVLEAWVEWLRNERKVSHTTVRTYWGAMHAVGQRLTRAYADLLRHARAKRQLRAVPDA